MTSNAAEPRPADSTRAAAAAPPAAAQLWIRAGNWLVRADQVIAVGYDKNEHARAEVKYSVEVATAGSRGYDGDIAPATYTLVRFAEEEQARSLAVRVVELMATWKHGYGTLSVTDQGHVRTSRPRPASTSNASEDRAQAGDDTEAEN